MSFQFKIIGCFFIIVSSTVFGFNLSLRLKRRKDFFISFLDFLCNLESNIKFLQEDIFSLIYKSSSAEFFGFIEDEKENSITEYWENVIEKIPKEYGLKKEDYKLIKDFGNTLGTTDIEGQQNHINLYKDLFSMQLNNAINEYKQKSKLYKVMGFFIGTVITLMII